jgi:TolB-like protein/DNA-binding winged helix-turn-helix (wHTH) protein/Tfp pilus assembly protein PilF
MEEGTTKGRSYRFGEIHLDTDTKIIKVSGVEVHLARRPFDVLSFLLENNDRVVSRAELLDEFWNGHEVYDDALRKCVGAIRKVLSDDRKPPRFIETRYGGGYRFIGEVSAFPANGNGKGEAGRAETRSEVASRFQGSRLKYAAFLVSLSVLLIGLAAFIFISASSPAKPESIAAPVAPFRSIAVMPIKNFTGDPANEYFSDGLTESIITQLSRGGELTIISRSSTFMLKNKDVDPREIGKQLNVDTLLEGAVQKKDKTVNVRVRLVNAKDGSVLWTSNDFERSLAGANDLQDLIACNVAAELKAKLCGTSPNSRTDNGYAYQEYLKGRFEWNKRTGDGIKKSIEHYRKAIEFDPKYALAYAGLADSYVQGIWHVPFNENEVVSKARKAGLQAIEIDDSLAEAHAAIATVYSLEWRWDEAEREVERAIQLNPGYSRAYHVKAFCLMLRGSYAESIAAIDHAAMLDPLNLVVQSDKGNLLLAAHRTEDAFLQWEKTLDLDPTFLMALEHRATAYELIGNEAAAIQGIAAIMKQKGDSQVHVDTFVKAASKKGLMEVRRRELNAMLLQAARGQHVSPVRIAMWSALVGDRDKAFEYLEKARSERNPQLVLLVSPQFWPLRPDPRFSILLDQVGLHL